ncbi:hypothetical protein BSL78_13800 [Apostichopus japonicus]|uniref:Uncharacterized protein n=1 Tax=Stichopus japonicus TaxID=307972 RepID=A0A2G8KMW3_STIJA|nr:hypothetical protein BSL78_13800 [Apostichopus japonicus]
MREARTQCCTDWEATEANLPDKGLSPRLSEESAVDMCDDPTNDPDYQPTEQGDGICSTRHEPIPDIDDVDELTPPHIEPKYLVFESSLMGLFNLCPECHGESQGRISHIRGSLIVINHVCQNQPQPCGFNRKWYSQPFIGNIPAGYSGDERSKCSSFIVHQRLYLQPAIVNTWERMQFKMVEDLKESEEKLVIGGDARNDSPGHTAKYGSYTFLEQNLNKVIHVELVQKNEVANSYQMELEALKRGIAWLQTMELEMRTIITDRHMQVTAWIREELTKKEDIKHYFDVWHISKGIKKKLRAAAAMKDCGLINDWIKSITNHLYWCASSSPDGDGGVMAAKWASIVKPHYEHPCP